MKLGIIGAVDIAESMARIFLRNRTVSASEISVYDTNSDKLNYWAGTYDIIPCGDIESVIKNCQILFIAVDGSEYPKLLPNMDYLLRTYRPLVVSFARGKSLEDIETLMDFIPPMAKIMTNINIGSGMGITAYCFNELVTVDQKEMLIEMFSKTGLIVEIDEEYLDVFSAVSTLSSVFACKLIDTLTSCGMLEGLSKDTAYKTVLQSVLGTTKSLSESRIDLNELMDKLCHSKSMALEATLTLKENGFEKSLIRAFKVSETNEN